MGNLFNSLICILSLGLACNNNSNNSNNNSSGTEGPSLAPTPEQQQIPDAAATASPTVTPQPTGTPTLRPTIQPTTFRPTVSPSTEPSTAGPTVTPTTAQPTLRPSIDRHCALTTSDIVVTLNLQLQPLNQLTTLTFPAQNRLVPPGCVLLACNVAVDNDSFLFLRLVGNGLYDINVVDESNQGLPFGLVATASLTADSAACLFQTAAGGSNTPARLPVSVAVTSAQQNYLVVGPRSSDNFIADGSPLRIQITPVS